MEDVLHTELSINKYYQEFGGNKLKYRKNVGSVKEFLLEFYTATSDQHTTELSSITRLADNRSIMRSHSIERVVGNNVYFQNYAHTRKSVRKNKMLTNFE